jgi:hypothetical protein
MDRFEASVLNKITERHGPFWTVVAILSLRRWWWTGAGAGASAVVVAAIKLLH